MLVIALVFAALVGYGFYAANYGEQYRLLLTIGVGISLFLPLCGVLAVGVKGRGSTGNLRALSAVFFVLMLTDNLIFSFVSFRLAPYIIITGILLLIYALIVYAVTRALK
jgi:hypothetical protein